MKVKYFLLAFSCIISASLFSQSTFTVYYNENWEEIANKDQASFYRKAFLNSNNVWEANDYYISDKIQMSGTFKSRDLKTKNGQFVYYFENGQKSSEGVFRNDKKEGLWITWYENGNKLSEGNYKNDKRVGTWSFYYENGQLYSKGNHNADEEDAVWEIWYETGEKMAMGKLVKEIKVGSWKQWYTNGVLKCEEIYKEGYLSSTVYYFDNGSIKYKGDFMNSIMNGEWVYYNIDGRITLKGNYVLGVPVGEWTRYFRDSEMKIHYKNGTVETGPLGGILVNK